MNEIMFRGKEGKTEKWRYGSIVYISGTTKNGDLCEGGWYIIDKYGQKYKVIHPTVGQYTGRCDIKGAYSFSGDIIRFTGGITGVIYYEEDDAMFRVKSINTALISSLMCLTPFEVIGNVADNPELLEVL